MEEGKVPPPTLPEINFLPFGVSWKGGETLVPVDCHPERSEGSTLFNGGGEGTLLQLHPKRVKAFSEVSLKRNQKPPQNSYIKS